MLTMGVASALPANVKTNRHKAVLKMDTAGPVTVRHFDSVALKKYSKLPEFQYKDNVIAPSWWDRFWNWFWGEWDRFWAWVARLFSKKTTGKGVTVSPIWFTVVKYTTIAVGVAALVFLILKLIGIDMQNIFRKKSASVPIPYSEFFEDINAIPFDEEIENAVAKHNYRLAVRLLYLKCLKQLSDAGLIEWQIDKTNSAYINELNNAEQRTAFKTLTLQFEYVWYGEFLIDAPVYSNINSSFRAFNQRVA
jgi:hypothetical protein